MSQIIRPGQPGFSSPHAPQPPQVQLAVCPRCGSAVANIELHEEFHAWLTAGLAPETKAELSTSTALADKPQKPVLVISTPEGSQ